MDVSVVIPVGDVDFRLREQLDALAQQRTDREFEVILAINRDGQVDQARLMSQEALPDRKVEIIDATRQRGAAAARNDGARAANTDVLLFCDADDRVEAEWVEGLASAVESHDAVTGRVELMTTTNSKHLRWRPPATPGGLPTFLGVPYILSGNLGVRRSAFNEVGGFDETLSRCEDIAISFRFIQHGYELGYSDAAVVQYRIRDGLLPMLKQHYEYGVGMSQVLARYGVPIEGVMVPAGRKLITPNGQRVQQRSLPAVLRRAAIAAGRFTGLCQEKLLAHR